MFSTSMALRYAPMVTEGSPFSIRCKVTRDIPAASAAVVALIRIVLRCARICLPSAMSLFATVVAMTGVRAGIVFLILDIYT